VFNSARKRNNILQIAADSPFPFPRIDAIFHPAYGSWRSGFAEHLRHITLHHRLRKSPLDLHFYERLVFPLEVQNSISRFPAPHPRTEPLRQSHGQRHDHWFRGLAILHRAFLEAKPFRPGFSGLPVRPIIGSFQ
jgi:hypothetical protein